MEFRLLGAVEMHDGDRVLDIGSPQQRHVVAALLADARQPVMAETLIDRVWDQAPTGARRTLQVQLTRIRRLLEQAEPSGRQTARVVRRSGGYMFDVDPESVDVHHFRQLVKHAGDGVCPEHERVALLREALALWRGQPLAGLPGEWAGRVREAWRQEYLGAVAAWADAELTVGNPDGVVARMTELVGDHPLEESLTAALMRSLYAVGRSAEALDCYAKTRRRLADDLGIDPGPQLQEVHRAILRGDLATVQPVAVPVQRSVPAQLPADLYGFAGRDDELARLDTVLTVADDAHTAVLICCVSGMAGIGKTTLAVHWAHQVAKRFPDGQLYMNLRGFDPTGAALSPAEAIGRFLRALDVPHHRIPADLHGQIALYRRQMAGRRVLVVLDNARDVEQIRPLLPGSPGNLVVVTSRNQLSGLVAAEGAVPVNVDLLSSGEAHDLLTRRIGIDRMAAEPRAAEEIAALCGWLPLALSVVAARAAIHPTFPLTAIADELRHAIGRLDALAGGHTTDIRAVFACSYHALGPAAAELFRLLALHHGPDLSVPAAASLAGTPERLVRPLLAELAGAHLIIEASPGRYAMHDLLRLYAAELMTAEESATDRADALHRLLDHYLHTAHAAALLLNPHRQAVGTLIAAQSGSTPEEFDDAGQALAWFTAEHAVLLAAIHQAAADGYDTHAWQLAWAPADFLHRQGHWQDQIAIQRIALSASRHASDRLGQANANRYLGRTYTRLSRLDDARTHLLDALDLFGELGDLAGQGNAHREICLVLEQQNRHRQALDHARHALELFRTAGHHAGQASSLNAIGWYHGLLGDHRQTITYCEQALALFQSIGNRALEGGTWDSLGYAHHHLGDHRQAIRCYERAIDLFVETGERYYKADTLSHAADAHRAAGDEASARQALLSALTILEELDHPDARGVQAKLRV